MKDIDGIKLTEILTDGMPKGGWASLDGWASLYHGSCHTTRFFHYRGSMTLAKTDEGPYVLKCGEAELIMPERGKPSYEDQRMWVPVTVSEDARLVIEHIKNVKY